MLKSGLEKIGWKRIDFNWQYSALSNRSTVKNKKEKQESYLVNNHRDFASFFALDTYIFS